MAAFIDPPVFTLILDYVDVLAKPLLTTYGQRDDETPISGWGENGLAVAQKEFEQVFLGATADLELTNLLGPALYQMRGPSKPEVVIANYFSDLLSRLGQAVQGMGLSGVVTLDQYMTFYNATPNFQQIYGGPYARFVFESLGLNPSARNFCYPIFTPGNFLARSVGGVFSIGNRGVDTTKYNGGAPRLKFTTRAVNNGVVTVTGNCYDPATNTILTGRTWVSSGTFTIANEERTLIPGGATPAPNYATMTSVTGISGVTAGNTFDVLLYMPNNRSSQEWIL